MVKKLTWKNSSECHKILILGAIRPILETAHFGFRGLPGWSLCDPLVTLGSSQKH